MKQLVFGDPTMQLSTKVISPTAVVFGTLQLSFLEHLRVLVLQNDATSRVAPLMLEAAHNRGECKPCGYFLYKSDGCRNGASSVFLGRSSLMILCWDSH